VSPVTVFVKSRRGIRCKRGSFGLKRPVIRYPPVHFNIKILWEISAVIINRTPLVRIYLVGIHSSGRFKLPIIMATIYNSTGDRFPIWKYWRNNVDNCYRMENRDYEMQKQWIDRNYVQPIPKVLSTIHLTLTQNQQQRRKIGAKRRRLSRRHGNDRKLFVYLRISRNSMCW